MALSKNEWHFLGFLGLAFAAYALTRNGGLLEVPPDSDFDPLDLESGTRVELEHTQSTETAKKIAKHHLMEDPDYYEKLATIHLD